MRAFPSRLAETPLGRRYIFYSNYYTEPAGGDMPAPAVGERYADARVQASWISNYSLDLPDHLANERLYPSAET